MLRSIDRSARLEVRLPADDGRVACPRLGEVDLERCLECSWLLRFQAGEHDVVVCSVTDPRTEVWE